MPQIKVLNNLLLAFITQEFSLAVFIRSYTNFFLNNPLIVQGVHFVFALFNLQGTAADLRAHAVHRTACVF